MLLGVLNFHVWGVGLYPLYPVLQTTVPVPALPASPSSQRAPTQPADRPFLSAVPDSRNRLSLRPRHAAPARSTIVGDFYRVARVERKPGGRRSILSDVRGLFSFLAKFPSLLRRPWEIPCIPLSRGERVVYGSCAPPLPHSCRMCPDRLMCPDQDDPARVIP